MLAAGLLAHIRGGPEQRESISSDQLAIGYTDFMLSGPVHSLGIASLDRKKMENISKPA